MDRHTEKAVRRMEPALEQWLGAGPDVWAIKEESAIPPETVYEGETWSTEQLHAHADRLRQEGRYADALNSCYAILDTCWRQTGKLPLVFAHSLFADLVSCNAFCSVFRLLTHLVEALQRDPHAAPEALDHFSDYLMIFRMITLDIVRYGDAGNLDMACAELSGRPDYQYLITQEEIRDQFAGILAGIIGQGAARTD